MTICQIPGCDEHYACRLRGKGLQVSPRVTTSRTQNWRPTPSVPNPDNGKPVLQDRPGGGKMPVFKPDGTQLLKSEYREQKSKFDDQLLKARTAPTP